MATSIKKVENPVIPIAFNIESNRCGFTNFIVFFLLRKCVSMINNENTEPIAVARPAPIIPMFKTNTKK